MKKSKPLQYLLVGVQFSGIAWFVFYGKLLPAGILNGILELLSLLIGIWAVLSMNSDTITILPESRERAEFTNKGPYRLIRHPMYTAVIFFLLSLLLNRFSMLSFCVWLVVLVDLLVKIEVEEKWLLQKYPQYEAYKEETYKIVPFVY